VIELEVTWARLLRVWWEWFWRNLLTTIGVLIVATVIGALSGVVLGAVGATEDTLQMVAAVIGTLVAVTATVIPLGLILNKDIGGFRLAIVSREDEPGSEAVEAGRVSMRPAAIEMPRSAEPDSSTTH